MTANVSISYLFIDGACLNAALDKIGEWYLDGVTPPLDWSRVRAPSEGLLLRRDSGPKV
jgi:hypothetical protein